MTSNDDDELLVAVRSGDAGALEALLERHQRGIYRFAMKMCRNSEDAEDVLQDTLFSVARSVREFRGASSISTWLYTVARSFCIKKRRKSKFAPHEERSLDADPAFATQTLIDPARSPDEAAAGKQIEQALERAIGLLDPSYREVLVLRDVEGMTAPEVARVLGIGEQAVKSRLHRARLSVREHMAPLIGPPSDPAAASATCPDVLTLFSRHVEDEISADVCAAMERHLEGCAQCRGACDSLKRSLSLCRTVGTSVEVPVAVQESVKIALRNLLAKGA